MATLDDNTKDALQTIASAAADIQRMVLLIATDQRRGKTWVMSIKDRARLISEKVEKLRTEPDGSSYSR